MKTLRADAEKMAGESALNVLGITRSEEDAYRWLLANPGATTSQIAQALSETSAKIHRLIEALESKGLVTHTPERPRCYLAASPDIAIEALALKHQEMLQRARGVIRELQEEAAVTRTGNQEKMVELITSSEAERQIVEQMSRTARHEVVALVRPPMLVSRLDVPPEKDTSAQREAQARGVSSRSIVDASFLQLPGAMARVLDDLERGEHVRVLSRLPFKMVITDRRLALVPLDLEHPSSPVLLVRSPALLEALYTLFGILWERAIPLTSSSLDVAGTLDSTVQPLDEEVRDLVPLMAAGLNDKSIASELGISASTLNRRIARAMKMLNVRTRFQLGWFIRGYGADAKDGAE